MDHNKLWEIFKEMGIPDHLICFLRDVYASQKVTIRTYVEVVQNGNQLGKEYDKTVYCHCLTYMQSTLCEMLEKMNHKLASTLLREIPTTFDMQMIPL